MRFSSRSTLIALTLLVLGEGTACTSRSPAEPSGLPVAPETSTSAFSLSCPANVEVQQRTHGALPVAFDSPEATGRVVLPVSTTCTPASGSLFVAGSTIVRCSATDAAQEGASCAFNVIVRPPRRLTKTRFLAFGDSVTEGFLGFGIDDPGASYPSVLARLLQARYPHQFISMTNAGLGGEKTDQGRVRLAFVIPRRRPDVLLLLEGYNNALRDGYESVGRDLRDMSMYALNANVDVLLANLTPVSRSEERLHPGTNAAYALLNGRLLLVGVELGIGPIVDLAGAFGSNRELLAPDGFHPSRLGYQKIAEMFFDEIVKRYEEPFDTFSPTLTAAVR